MITINDTRPKGRIHLPSGREVFNTGKVLIGCRSSAREPGGIGEHAEIIQAALLRKPHALPRCVSDACASGRVPCPTPELCMGPTSLTDRILMVVIFALSTSVVVAVVWWVLT